MRITNPSDKLSVARAWDFNWPVMEILIGGRSAIDLAELRFGSESEARDFVRAYGYDDADPADRQKMHATLVEAMAFIERMLLSPREWARGIRPPDSILNGQSPIPLLLLASDKNPHNSWERAWACAVVRVMHTIAHIEGVNRQIDVETARSQIFDRFQKYIFRDAERRLWFGDENKAIELDRVEWKEVKSRNSILLKLLHKRDNVAETIFDFLGIRIITKRLADVMQTMQLLRDLHMVVYPNCYPSRSRNNLIDLERFRNQVVTLREMLLAGSIRPEEFEEMIGRLTSTVPQEVLHHANPHSSTAYRSIQLTGRQLIKVKDIRFEWLEKIKGSLHMERLEPRTAKILQQFRSLIEDWHSVREGVDAGAFFPFEVQILDAESYEHAVSGPANHNRYKQSQIRAARKRVLAQVFEIARERDL